MTVVTPDALIEKFPKSSFIKRVCNWATQRHLVIGIAPRSVCVMLLQGWKIPRIVEQVELKVSGDGSFGDGSIDWAAYENALRELINASSWSDLPCLVVVPELWVRWVALEWDEGTSVQMSVEDVDVQVQQSFAKYHADLYSNISEWLVVSNAAHFRQTQLGAAIPRNLFESLVDVLGSRGLRIESCQSAHALAWNRWRSHDVEGRQLALHVRASRTQVFCTVDAQTLTFSWRYRPSLNLEQGSQNYLKIAERMFDGVHSVSVDTGAGLPVREIEQHLAKLHLDNAVVTVVVLGRKGRQGLLLSSQGGDYWYVIDATKAGGVSSAEAFCHLLSPRKREGLLSLLGLEFRRASDGVVINFVNSKNKPKLNSRSLPKSILTTFVLALVVFASGFIYLRKQADVVQSRLRINRPQVASAADSEQSKPVPTDQPTVEMMNATQVVASLDLQWERLFEAINHANYPNLVSIL